MTSILIAEDEPSLRELLRAALADHGYEVVTAADGHEAIAALDAQEFDLVLSNAAMPGPDGDEVLRTSKLVAPDTEVVVAGASGTARDWVSRGAFDLLEKPYTMVEMLAMLERALERRNLRAASALYQASREILDLREPTLLPEVIVGVAMKAMNADDVVLMLPGHDDKLYPACSRALTETIRAEVHDSIGDFIAVNAPMLRAPIIGSRPNIQSCIIYPLCSGERLVGVLGISRVVDQRAFRRLDLEKAGVLASQILLALENMRLVRQAIAAERLATVGQVATSIAHEVNNPIAYVLASEGHLREQLGHVVALCSMISAGADGSQLRSAFLQAGGQTLVEELLHAADDIREGAERVRDLVRDTRSLTSKDHDVQPFDVNEAIRSALRVVAAELRHKAVITTKLAEGLRVKGCVGRISQVFVNLLVNAGEAFGNRSANAIVITSQKVGAHILVTVRDNGPGIKADVLPRIFDSLITTKLSPTGTGLGLPISRDIVRSHGGEISVDSEPGRGTTFSIVLPLATRTREQPVTMPPPIDQETRPLRLMFVDDEPNILRSYSRAFGKAHEVVLAHDGLEALDALGRCSDYDLIVCDLSMPMMSGMELFRTIRERYPRLVERIVFATGGATQRDIEEFLSSITNLVLEKPFDMKVLRNLLADIQRVS